MCSLVLLLIIFYLQLVAISFNRCLSSLFAFTSFLRITFAGLQIPYQENSVKHQEFCESRFGGFEKDRYFLKF